MHDMTECIINNTHDMSPFITGRKVGPRTDGPIPHARNEGGAEIRDVKIRILEIH
jgi:hypothetical protein